METPVTWTQLIISSIFILIAALAPQLHHMYKARLESKEKERQAALKEKEQELAKDEQDTKHFEKIALEYQRQIEILGSAQVENAALRPLVLQNALLEQKITQAEEDKADWKSYATKLRKQLEANNIIPEPFRRLPHDGDTQERLKTISRKMQAIKLESEKERPAPGGSPTLVFPPLKRGDDEA